MSHINEMKISCQSCLFEGILLKQAGNSKCYVIIKLEEGQPDLYNALWLDNLPTLLVGFP